jgi:hypothetical protein
MVVDCKRIQRFMGFVANDLRESVTIFWRLLFRVFPAINPIKKVCFNKYLDYEWIISKSL